MHYRRGYVYIYIMVLHGASTVKTNVGCIGAYHLHLPSHPCTAAYLLLALRCVFFFAITLRMCYWRRFGISSQTYESPPPPVTPSQGNSNKNKSFRGEAFFFFAVTMEMRYRRGLFFLLWLFTTVLAPLRPMCGALERTTCTWAYTLPTLRHIPLLHCGVPSYPCTAAYLLLALRCDFFFYITLRRCYWRRCGI